MSSLIGDIYNYLIDKKWRESLEEPSAEKLFTPGIKIGKNGGMIESIPAQQYGVKLGSNIHELKVYDERKRFLSPDERKFPRSKDQIPEVGRKFLSQNSILTPLRDDYDYLGGPIYFNSSLATFEFSKIDKGKLNGHGVVGTFSLVVRGSELDGLTWGNYLWIDGPIIDSLTWDISVGNREVLFGNTLTGHVIVPVALSRQRSPVSTTAKLTIENPTTSKKKSFEISLKSGEKTDFEIDHDLIDSSGAVKITLSRINKEWIGLKSDSLHLSFAPKEVRFTAHYHYINTSDEYVTDPGFKTDQALLGRSSQGEVIAGERSLTLSNDTWFEEGFSPYLLDMSSKIKIELSTDGGQTYSHSFTSSTLSSYKDVDELIESIEASLPVTLSYDSISDSFTLEVQDEDVTHLRLTDLNVSSDGKKGFFEFIRLNLGSSAEVYTETRNFQTQSSLYWIGVDTDLVNLKRGSIREVLSGWDKIDRAGFKDRWQDEGFKVWSDKGLDLTSRIRVTVFGGVKPGTWISRPLQEYNDFDELQAALEGALDVSLSYNTEKDRFEIKANDPWATGLRLADVEVREGQGFFEYTGINPSGTSAIYVSLDRSPSEAFAEWRFWDLPKDEMVGIRIVPRASVFEKYGGPGGEATSSLVRVSLWNPEDSVWDVVSDRLNIGYEEVRSDLGDRLETKFISPEVKVPTRYLDDEGRLKIRLERLEDEWVGVDEKSLRLKFYRKQTPYTVLVAERLPRGVWRWNLYI